MEKNSNADDSDADNHLNVEAGTKWQISEDNLVQKTNFDQDLANFSS